MRSPALAYGLLLCLALSRAQQPPVARAVGRLREVFAWRQITYNINGNMVLQDRFGGDDIDDESSPSPSQREKRQAETVFFNHDDGEQDRNWNQLLQDRFGGDDIDDESSPSPSQREKRQAETVFFNHDDGEQDRNWNQQSSSNPARPGARPRPGHSTWNMPTSSTRRPSTTTSNPSDEAGRFFVQYNNLPMGAERVGDRLFVTMPRRRYGVVSTLNYLDLNRDSNTRSPGLRPYPSLRESRALTSVYRTRADECGRLWMVDTGMLEIPNNRQQVQQPAIVVYDLRTNKQILRYPLKTSDLPSEITPTGLASITIDITNGDCNDAYAYVPDLATYGLIVFSLRERDSWRLSHNYFSFNPVAGNLRIAGQSFQWNDGIFSVTLASASAGAGAGARADGCRVAYFHPMVSTQEFSVSTCVLRNRTASSDSNFWTHFSVVGDRGTDSQSNMHGYHAGTNVIFFADIARDAISCWNAGSALSSAAIGILARDSKRLSYPSDLHVTGDEVWVMANSLPTWAYSQLDTSDYNFFIYKANVQDLISGTVCAGRGYSGGIRSRAKEDNDVTPSAE